MGLCCTIDCFCNLISLLTYIFINKIEECKEMLDRCGCIADMKQKAASHVQPPGNKKSRPCCKLPPLPIGAKILGIPGILLTMSGLLMIVLYAAKYTKSQLFRLGYIYVAVGSSATIVAIFIWLCDCYYTSKRLKRADDELEKGQPVSLTWLDKEPKDLSTKLLVWHK